MAPQFCNIFRQNRAFGSHSRLKLQRIGTSESEGPREVSFMSSSASSASFAPSPRHSNPAPVEASPKCEGFNPWEGHLGRRPDSVTFSDKTGPSVYIPA